MLQKITSGLSRCSGGPGTPHRADWRSRRDLLEQSRRRHTVRGPRRRHALQRLLPLVGAALDLAGLYRLGIRNALSPRLVEMELPFPNLPPVFDGYRILHLSDTHFENLPGAGEAAARILDGQHFDLVALTGDLQRPAPTDPQNAVRPLKTVLAAVTCRDGVVATLGNHDTPDLVPHLEALGVMVLINEHAAVRREGSLLQLAGTDDISSYFTPDAVACLGSGPDVFRVALVHSPELAQAAAGAGFSLYLAGHTHGGQICMPGGRPILTSVVANRAFARGLWSCGDMIGYTTTGLGSATLPVRFACAPEVVAITLRSAIDGKPRPMPLV